MRVPSFLAMVSGMLQPLGAGSDQEKQDIKNQEHYILKLKRLISHLSCNQHYYTQQFLPHIAQKTNSQAIVDFVYQVIQWMSPFSSTLSTLLPSILDIERAFVDRQAIVVPSTQSLSDKDVTQLSSLLGSEQEFRSSSITPIAVEIDVPCDGVHLEVAEGGCKLTGVPQPDQY